MFQHWRVGEIEQSFPQKVRSVDAKELLGHQLQHKPSSDTRTLSSLCLDFFFYLCRGHTLITMSKVVRGNGFSMMTFAIHHCILTCLHQPTSTLLEDTSYARV